MREGFNHSGTTNTTVTKYHQYTSVSKTAPTPTERLKPETLVLIFILEELLRHLTYE